MERPMRLDEGEETQVKSTENIFNQIKEEKLPKLRGKVSIKKQGTYRTQNRKRRKKSPLPIIIKTLNVQYKERILKATRIKRTSHKSRPVRITSGYWMETLKARRTSMDIFYISKRPQVQSRLLYPAKLSVTINRERKAFHDKTKFK